MEELHKFDYTEIIIDQVWFISSPETAEHIYDLLIRDLTKKEILFVIQIDGNNRNFYGKISNDAVKWIDSHSSDR